MRSRGLGQGRRSQQVQWGRGDLVFRSALVAALWATLRMLGGDLSPLVSVAVIAAIFGPDVFRSGRDWLSEGLSSKDRR